MKPVKLEVPGHPAIEDGACRVVAEFGQAMGGDLEVAKHQAKAAKDAGAWAYKVQLLTPEKIAAADSPIYWGKDGVDHLGNTNQRDTFRRNGLIPYGAWADVKAYCDSIGILFMGTPFDCEAVDALVEMDTPVIKVASGDLTYRKMLKRIGRTGRIVVLSTGAATPGEVYRAMEWLEPCPVVVLSCSLAYPTAPEDANLARIEALSGFPAAAIGISDHTLEPFTSFAAAAMGCHLAEKHCTTNPDGDVPDDAMGLSPERLAQYVAYAEVGARMRGKPDISPSSAEQAALVGARRSLHAAKFLRKGHVLTEGDLVALRPGDGLSPSWEEGMMGLKATRILRAGEKLQKGDVA